MTAQGENRTSLKAGSLTNTLSYFVQLFRYQFYGRGHVHSAWCPFGLMAPRPPPRDTQFVRQIKSNLVDTLRPSPPCTCPMPGLPGNGYGHKHYENCAIIQFESCNLSSVLVPAPQWSKCNQRSMHTAYLNAATSYQAFDRIVLYNFRRRWI